MYDYFLSAIESFIRYGVSPTALVVALIAFFRTKRFKRLLARRFPWLFRDEMDVLNYQARQIRIERKLDTIAAHMGVRECHVESKSSSIDTVSRSIMPLPVVGWYARFVNVRMDLITKIIHLRRNNKMKKWIKPDSLTAYGAVIIVAINRYFGFEIDPANIIGAAVLLIGYFKSQELVTVVRDANGLPSGFRLNSRKLIFTMVAFLFVVVDELFKLGLPTDIIMIVAAAVTGANYLEAKKDVKQAEAEGADARQLY